MTKICNDKGGFDKVKHVLLEFVIALITGILLTSFTTLEREPVAIISFCVAMVFGIGREILGALQKGNHFCVWDLAWDVIGSLAGALFVALVHYGTYHDIAGNLLI